MLEQAKEATQRMEKHIDLDKAINEIHQLHEHTNQILLKITGGDKLEPAISDTKRPMPTLQEVLNQGPERIRDTCTTIHKILEEIEQTLF